MASLEEKLREKHLKITPQRLEVMRAFKKVRHHPSADAIYQAVKQRYPSVSLATVYKTLETLVEIGEIRVALVHWGKTLYDTRLDDHHHFICNTCGYVEDVDINLDCIDTCAPSQMTADHQIARSEVVFYGLCQRCQKKGPSASASPVH